MTVHSILQSLPRYYFKALIFSKYFILIAYFSEKAFDKAFQLEDNADPNASGGGGGGNGEEMTESGQNITTTLIEQSTRQFITGY